MIVAGAGVHIATQPIVILAHHEQHLAVRLQSEYSVTDVDPHALELLSEGDVGGLIEARLQLHHHRHLLAVADSLLEVLDDPRIL